MKTPAPLRLLAVFPILLALASLLLMFPKPFEPNAELTGPATAIESSFERIDRMEEVPVREIIQHAMNSEFAVIYLHAGWHTTSVYARRHFAELAAKYHLENPKSNVRFHYVDRTDLSASDVEQMLDIDYPQIQGSGEILWLRYGELIERFPLGLDNDLNELTKKTNNLVNNAG